MIYLKNIREKQTVYIPRTEINGKVVAVKSYDEGYTDGIVEGKKLQKLKLTNLTVSENGVYKREDGWNEVDIDVKPSLQSKTINVTKDVEIVMADDAFDGLSRVDVNATQYGKNKRNEGYNQGYLEGEDYGYTEGKTEGYDEGLTNAGKTARVLNITENGVYTTKYSEPYEANAQVTGYFDDNTPFYGYARLTNHIIATGIIPTKTSKVELWWRPDFNGSGYIFANTSVLLNGIYLKVDGGKFSVKFGNYTRNNQLEVEDKWYHIVVSPDGLVIDGERITTLGTPSMFIAGAGLFINGDGVTTIGNVCANGYFGMVKIDGKTFIPTEDGFIDYTTDTILTAYKKGDYDYEKPTYEGNLIRTIRVSVAGGSDDGYDDGYNAGYFVGQTEGYNAGKTDGASEQKSKLESIEITVNGTYTKEDGYDSIVVKVPDVNGSYDEGYADGYEEGKESGSTTSKIKVFDYGVNIQDSTFTTIPEWMDFEGVTNFREAFRDCEKLTVVNDINTNSATSMSYMFWNCINLTTAALTCTNVTTMEGMFDGCKKLNNVILTTTSNVTNMAYMFQDCWMLTSLPLFTTSKVLQLGWMFDGCTNLTNVENLKPNAAKSFYSTFRKCTKLTSIPALNASNLEYLGADLFGDTDLPNLTDFGGLVGLKMSSKSNEGFVRTPNLTLESCLNILNGLYDFTGNGETPTSSQGRLKVHQNFLNLVGDQISIGTSRGWTITAG